MTLAITQALISTSSLGFDVIQAADQVNELTDPGTQFTGGLAAGIGLVAIGVSLLPGI